MNPENMNSDALTLFNSLGEEARSEAIMLTEEFSENEAVYLAAMRSMDDRGKRELLFELSQKKWAL